jgi:hypothetical protein
MSIQAASASAVRPLSMIEATIRGDASFHQGFTTNGVVDLRLAQIGPGAKLQSRPLHRIGRKRTHSRALNDQRNTLLGRYHPYAAHRARSHQRARRVAVGRHYPPFNAMIYSLENFLPLVDLHQGTYWRPNPHHGSAGQLRAFSGKGA